MSRLIAFDTETTGLKSKEGDRIVELWGNVERQTVERRGTSIPDYLDWRARSSSFDLMSAWKKRRP